MAEQQQLYYGDIHNHNALGYGVGSLERSIDIARRHLDFFAFTGHSSWHDIEPMEGGREGHWYRGFEKHNSQWGTIQELIAEANRLEDFAAILGYEWHSSRYGDHCLLFPGDRAELVAPDSIEELRSFCLETGALMIPHHLAYPRGRRGVNWDIFDPTCTPIVEVYSEHGNSEEDRGLYPFFNHSFGGRVSSQTIQAALEAGLKFGFYASTDSHRGFPGAYGEGLMAAWADGLDRESILEAIRSRRTYGLTGDRIEISFQGNGMPMGSELLVGERVEVDYQVSGRDDLEVVELIHNGSIVDRGYPGEESWDFSSSEPFQCRLEWGWGPWGDLALDRICDWAFEVKVEGGEVLRHFEHWQSGPFDEDRRHGLRETAPGTFTVESFTSRKGAYRQNPNQSLLLEMKGKADTQVTVTLEKPVQTTFSMTAGELLAGGKFLPTGPFPKESMLMHRLVPPTASQLKRQIELPSGDRESGYLYLRARQKNGQMAWVSPLFLNR